MTNEIQVYENNYPTQAEMTVIANIARTAHASGLYAGVGQEAKILMVLLSARELGIGPMAALNGGIWNIQGRIEISARLMNGMIRRAGHSINIIKSDDNVCILKGKRKDGDEFECSFSMTDASKAGLHTKDVWKKYAQDMLYNRCMSRLARRLFSDVIGEAYIQGEISDLPESSDVSVKNVSKPNVEPIKLESIQDLPKEEEPKLSEEQINDLQSMLDICSKEYVECFHKNIKQYWDANGLADIHVKKYDALVSKIRIHLESAEVVNV